MRWLRAGGAGGAGPGAGCSLESDRGVTPKRRGPNRSRRRSRCDERTLEAVDFLSCVVAVLPDWTSRPTPRAQAGAGLHARDVACEQGRQGLGLGGFSCKLVVEGKGLDGKGRGPLVLAVADHC